MRNLKRVLSLAVASVMLIGMMVVGSSAGFDDVTIDHNEEAIAVAQATGIMIGDEKGNFNPDQDVTRNEAAVIMTNVLGLDASKFAGTSPFTDVPDWAEPYVAAAYANGIVAGTSATTYGGSDKVTTAQFSLMLMKALEYFQNPQDFGDDWKIATVRQATKIELNKGVSAGPDEALVRNEVAQMVLNGLEADVVEFTGDLGTDIKTSDGTTITIGYNPDYDPLPTSYDYTVDRDPVDDATLQLAEKLYGNDLRKDGNQRDAWGRVATQWIFENVVVGDYADEANKVYTAGVKGKDIYKDLGLNSSDPRTFNVTVDGDDTSVAPITLTNTMGTIAQTGNGAVTYVYYDRLTSTYEIAIINTYVGEVVAEGENADDEREITISGANGGSFTYVTENYAEDDIVLFTVLDTDKDLDITDESEVETVALAEKKTGALTKIVGTNDYYIDGVKINGAKQKWIAGAVGAGDDVDFYTDAYGYIIWMDEAEAAFDVANMALVLDGVSPNAKGVAWAKLLFSDGTTKVVDTAKDYKSADIDPATGGVQNIANNQLVSFKVEDDGTYKLTLKTVAQGNATAGFIQGKPIVGNSANLATETVTGSKVRTDAQTVFVYAINNAGDIEYEVYTGHKNAPGFNATTAASTNVVAYNKDQTGTALDGTRAADIVFVQLLKGELDNTSEDMTVIAFDPDVKMTQIKDVNNYYEYAAVIDGEITTIKIDAVSSWSVVSAKYGASAANIYDVVTYDSDDVATVIPSDQQGTSFTQIQHSNETIVIEGAAMGYADDVEVYEINDDGEIVAIDIAKVQKDNNMSGSSPRNPYAFGSYTVDSDGYVNLIVLYLVP